MLQQSPVNSLKKPVSLQQVVLLQAVVEGCQVKPPDRTVGFPQQPTATVSVESKPSSVCGLRASAHWSI